MSNCRVWEFFIWSWPPLAIRPPWTSTRYPSGTGPATSFSAISKTIELLVVAAAAFVVVENAAQAGKNQVSTAFNQEALVGVKWR